MNKILRKRETWIQEETKLPVQRKSQDDGWLGDEISGLHAQDL